METNEVKKLRYKAFKCGLRFRQVQYGYKLYNLDGDSVSSIEGLDCSGVLTLEEIQLLIVELTTKKKNCG